VIIGFYFILGFFIETLSLMIITIPIVAPLMIQLGFDPVWFGIVLIVLIEMALITPPVGLNLFVVQSVRQRGTLMDVVVGAIPFVIAMFVMVLLLVAFPQIALLLPQMTTG
jgi:TRAP-type C4-dicarboxylate transport system permease large subunit